MQRVTDYHRRHATRPAPPRFGRRSVRLGYLAALALLMPALLFLFGGGLPVWPAAGAQTVATPTAKVATPGGPPAPSGPVLPRGVAGRTAVGGPGAVLAWGIGVDGELGDATNLSTSTAVAVQGLTGVTILAHGPSAFHSLAVRRDGSVAAWGSNGNGQLGDGTTTDRNVPVRVTILLAADPVVGVAAGVFHSLAVTESGAVWAWGGNGSGQLGDGTTTQRTAPVRVKNSAGTGNLSGIVAVAAGGNHSLAIAGNGTVYAWGANGNGQLGDFTLIDRALPVAVVGVGGVGTLDLGVCTSASGSCAVAAGQNHSLARSADGRVHAWGLNGDGQLGNGGTLSQNTPVAVLPVSGTGQLFTNAIAAGAYHSLAVGTDGTALAWGNNNVGQLGDGSTADRSRPAVVTQVGTGAALTGVAGIAGGFSHSLAVTASGSVHAWGYNLYGQLGDGSAGTNKTRAVAALNLAGISAVAAGQYHSLALGPDYPLATVTPQFTATPQPTATPYIYAPPPTSAGSLFLISPVRVLDTRAAPFGPIGFDAGGSQLVAAPFQDGDLRTFRVAGKTFQGFALPAGIKGVVFTLTAAQAAPTGGFVTVFPGGAALPASSTLNPSGATGATAVGGTVALDAVGNLQIKSVGSVRDIILDVSAYYQ